MKNEEAAKMLTAKVECMKREVSGTDLDCNHRNCDECDLCYAQGTIGEQKEALRMAISALEKQDVPDTNVGDMISRQAAIDAAEKESQVDGAYGYMDTKSIVDLLNDFPSAHPEIVRCKDCIRYGKDNCFMKIQMLWELKPDDFCSYAERRTDGRD